LCNRVGYVYKYTIVADSSAFTNSESTVPQSNNTEREREKSNGKMLERTKRKTHT